jgi:LPS sulfotransferase NodH
MKKLLQKRRINEFIIFLSYIFLPKNKNKKVVIFAQGRTGSTVLEKLLDSTGYFSSNGEILGASWILFPYMYVEGLSKLKSNNNFLFHVKIYHLNRDRRFKVNPEKFLRKLHKNGWTIIYLKRENKLNHVISTWLAEQRNLYHLTNNASTINKPSIIDKTPTEVLNGIKQRKYFDEQEQEVLKNIPHIKIVYEKDLQSPEVHQKTVNKILNKLNLPPKKASTSLKKIVTKKQSEILKNYDEICEVLKKEGFDNYIEN